jgi:urease accessory protein
MYDGVSLSDGLQRARGELRVSVKRRDAASVLDGLRQAGCLKARFPRPIEAGWCDITMLNSSGGVAAGDRLDFAFSAGPGARATIAAQAAERFYRALPGGGPSVVRTSVQVAQGAALEWLPQETILFDHSALDRRLIVDVAPDARFLGCEMLVFGRAAMGETVTAAHLRDLIRVERAGMPLLHDAIRLDGAVDVLLARSATGDGARAVSTIVYVAPDAEGRLDAVRATGDFPVSAWNGMLVARLIGPDAALVRRDVLAVLAVLRDGRPMPRVWLC